MVESELDVGHFLNGLLIGGITICCELASMKNYGSSSGISRLSTILMVLLGVAVYTPSHATHLDGGSISYTKISGSTYTLRLLAYEECGSMPQSPFLASNTQQVLYVRNRCGSAPVSVPVFRTVYPAVQVPNKCQQLTSLCTGGTLKGIRYVVFEGTFTFPQVSSNSNTCNEWDITYGSSSEVGLCCRSFAGNLSQTPGGSSSINTTFFLQAYLNNNPDVGNSSGLLALHTTPFFCAMPSILNVEHGEPDGDSLVYAFVPVVTGFQSPANYTAGLSGAQPLQGVPGGMQIDQSNGNISFKSTVSQVSAVGIERKEYRGGILVGSITLVTNVVISAGAYCGILRDTIYLAGCDSLLLPNGQTVYADSTYSDTIVIVNACDTIKYYSYSVSSQPLAPLISGQAWAIPGSTTNFTVVNPIMGHTYEWQAIGGSTQPGTGTETSVTWGSTGQGEVILTSFLTRACTAATQMTVQVSGGVGIFEQNKVKPYIAPNPAMSQLLINNLEVNERILLYDVSGKLLDTWYTNERSLMLDLSQYPNGLYQLCFHASHGIYFEKLIILR